MQELIIEAKSDYYALQAAQDKKFESISAHLSIRNETIAF